jgi:hypothetical protein
MTIRSGPSSRPLNPFARAGAVERGDGGRTHLGGLKIGSEADLPKLARLDRIEGSLEIVDVKLREREALEAARGLRHVGGAFAIEGLEIE